MKPRLFAMAMNVMMRMIAGKRYFGGEGQGGELGLAGSEEEARRFQEIVEETFAVSGATNLGDFVPLLRVLDYKGVERRLVRLQEKRDTFMQGIVDERRRIRRRGGDDDDDDDDDDKGEGGRKTIIDVLLNLQESDPEYYTDEIIKGVLVVMLSAGTDTSVVTIEWAMALLLSHPDVMEKARAELDLRVGSGRLVQESDLSDLPYLQCIIKETLRLYPAGPLIPAHESTEDCTVAGYHVPRGTMLLVNAWAIHRDPTNWTEPTQFRPERFLVEREEVEGSMVMLPFGLGRRRCPGEGLAMRVVGLALAALVQCFEWDVGSEGVDMTEGTGLTMPMAKPLVAACKPRTAVIHAQLATVGAA
ncbi:Cytochrome P450 81D1 [Ananas comosus]|uniref:Cytochrome P450 81D1 n=1 Tax=Ananas comosus TaxID=4615 RepID=A0A199VRC6_ANACO|nr:Cytochrome P450 81D1 [Ananas comosus]